MTRREDRELWRFGIFAVIGLGILAWIYVIEPVVNGWGWL